MLVVAFKIIYKMSSLLLYWIVKSMFSLCCGCAGRPCSVQHQYNRAEWDCAQYRDNCQTGAMSDTDLTSDQWPGLMTVSSSAFIISWLQCSVFISDSVDQLNLQQSLNIRSSRLQHCMQLAILCISNPKLVVLRSFNPPCGLVIHQSWMVFSSKLPNIQVSYQIMSWSAVTGVKNMILINISRIESWTRHWPDMRFIILSGLSPRIVFAL